MKTPFLQILSGLLLLSFSMTSCNGCSDKTPTNDSPPEVTPASSSASGSIESADTDAEYGDAASSTNEVSSTSGTSAETSVQTTTTTTSKKPARKLKGYSAPDGTKAENSDGDMYTKHDTTPMPSGVPIK